MSGSQLFGAWAYDERFNINTVEPSTLVLDATVNFEIITQGQAVLDLGGGENPRNTVFLAHEFQCKVNAYDLQPIIYPDPLPPKETLDRIIFHEGDILQAAFPEGNDTALLIRLIQYISPDNLPAFLLKVTRALNTGGNILISYTAEGGILSKLEQYKIDGYSHSIDVVRNHLLDCGFAIKLIREGANKSTNVPHSNTPAKTFEIIGEKV